MGFSHVPVFFVCVHVHTYARVYACMYRPKNNFGSYAPLGDKAYWQPGMCQAGQAG